MRHDLEIEEKYMEADKRELGDESVREAEKTIKKESWALNRMNPGRHHRDR